MARKIEAVLIGVSEKFQECLYVDSVSLKNYLKERTISIEIITGFVDGNRGHAPFQMAIRSVN